MTNLFVLPYDAIVSNSEDEYDSAVTYGPTICSFGLKYNDHNYALPSGLTPPSMAPHLMDIRPPSHQHRTIAESSGHLTLSDALTDRSSSARVEMDAQQQHNKSDEAADTPVTDHHRKSDRSRVDHDQEQQLYDESSTNETREYARYWRQMGYENIELRSEPELKVGHSFCTRHRRRLDYMHS